MEIKLGIYRCSFGASCEITEEQLTNLPELGNLVADIQDDCQATTSHYRCNPARCQIGNLLKIIRIGVNSQQLKSSFQII